MKKYFLNSYSYEEKRNNIPGTATAAADYYFNKFSNCDPDTRNEITKDEANKLISEKKNKVDVANSGSSIYPVLVSFCQVECETWNDEGFVNSEWSEVV